MGLSYAVTLELACLLLLLSLFEHKSNTITPVSTDIKKNNDLPPNLIKKSR
jgi:hypothetical protein